MISYTSEISASKILVVDDTPENLKLLIGILQESSYDVRTAINGKLALDAAEIAPPDLILLDIKMPEMSGFEVCQRLKKNPQTRDIPVLFISALNDSLDKVAAFEVGGVDYITKPFESAEVMARINTHISLVQAKRKLAEREEFSRFLLETISEGIISMDVNGKATFVNPAAARMLGYDAEELVGQLVKHSIRCTDANGKIYPPDQSPILDAIKNSTLVKADDHYFLCKNGNSIPVTYSCTRVLQGGITTGAVLAFTGITE